MSADAPGEFTFPVSDAMQAVIVRAMTRTGIGDENAGRFLEGSSIQIECSVSPARVDMLLRSPDTPGLSDMAQALWATVEEASDEIVKSDATFGYFAAMQVTAVCQELLDSGMSPAGVDWIIGRAVELGRAWERIKARDFESLAISEKRRKDNARKASAPVNAERARAAAAKHAHWQELVDKIQNTYGVTKQRACKAVALYEQDRGDRVNRGTVEKHTTGRRPVNAPKRRLVCTARQIADHLRRQST